MNINFNDIVGNDEAKEMLTTRLQAFLEFREQLDSPSKGILLYGYPGTAKTMMAIALVNTIDTSKALCKIVTADELTMHVGTTAAKVKSFFAALRREAGDRAIILILDEADEILTVKGDKSVIANERVSAILRELDGMENNETDIYIIATTNHPLMIEPAMLRSGRIDTSIKTELPTDLERKELLIKYCNNIPGVSGQIDHIWQFTYKWTGADYKKLSNELKIKYLIGKKTNPEYILTPEEIVKTYSLITKQRSQNFAKFEAEYANLTSGNSNTDDYSEIYKMPKTEQHRFNVSMNLTA